MLVNPHWLLALADGGSFIALNALSPVAFGRVSYGGKSLTGSRILCQIGLMIFMFDLLNCFYRFSRK